MTCKESQFLGEREFFSRVSLENIEELHGNGFMVANDFGSDVVFKVLSWFICYWLSKWKQEKVVFSKKRKSQSWKPQLYKFTVMKNLFKNLITFPRTNPHTLKNFTCKFIHSMVIESATESLSSLSLSNFHRNCQILTNL